MGFLLRTILTFSLLVIPSFNFAENLVPVSIRTLYGEEVVEEPIILELLASPAMVRLQSIDQSGYVHYLGRIEFYPRYIHSFGVYQILKRFNASLEEQIAGLLHDTSHTVFSHVGDWLFFQGSHEEAYQDDIQAWYLSKQGVDQIAEKFGMPFKHMLEKGNGYNMLDQELPDICCDRLEYNLFTGHLQGFFTQEDITEILADIHYENGKWFFEDPAVAAKFARVSIYFTEHLWGADWNVVINEFCARALKRALEIEILTMDQIHFAKDSEVLAILDGSEDVIIRGLLDKCKNIEDWYELCEKEQADYSCKCKFRGIDPLVRINGDLVRLTTLDGNFAEYYYSVKAKTAKGIHVRFK